MYWCPYRHSKDRRRAFNRKNQRAYASWIACLFRFIALVFICIFLDCMSCLFKFSALVLDCIFAKLIHVFSQGDDGLGDDVEVELPAPMPVGRVGGGSVLWQIFFLIFHWSVDWSYFGFFFWFSIGQWIPDPWRIHGSAPSGAVASTAAASAAASAAVSSCVLSEQKIVIFSHWLINRGACLAFHQKDIVCTKQIGHSLP